MSRKSKQYKRNVAHIDEEVRKHLEKVRACCYGEETECKHSEVYEETDFTVGTEYFAKSKKCKQCQKVLSSEKVKYTEENKHLCCNKVIGDSVL